MEKVWGRGGGGQVRGQPQLSEVSSSLPELSHNVTVQRTDTENAALHLGVPCLLQHLGGPWDQPQWVPQPALGPRDAHPPWPRCLLRSGVGGGQCWAGFPGTPHDHFLKQLRVPAH